MTSDLADFRFRLASSIRHLNWPAIGVTLALEALFLGMLISLGVVSVTRVSEEMKVIRLLPTQEPPPAAPAQAAAEKPEVKPDPQPQPRTEVIVPTPKVELPPVSQPVVAATEPPPAPVAAAPAAPKAAAATGAGSGPVSVANLNTNLLSGTPPAYPMASRRKREQGTVVLRLVISEDGRVADVAVHRSSGYPALDQAAVAAVRKWRWSPTMRDGRAVPITGLVQIPFVLKEG